MKRVVAGVFILIALLYLAAPVWAGWQLRQAVRNRDQEALARHVDWDLLRANLKPRFARAIEESADTSGVVGGLLKRTLGAVASNAAVDAFVTPANLALILAGRAYVKERLPAGSQKAPDPPEPAAGEDDPMPPRRLRWAFFESPTRFRIESTHPRLPNGRVVAILALQGLVWKLVDVDVIQR